MLELFLGFFLLGSLSLAFREYSEHDPASVEPQSDFTRDQFDQSVYEPGAELQNELERHAQHPERSDHITRAEQMARTDDFHKVFQSLNVDSGAELDC